ncbi:MAG: beta-lactamase family protein [Desulfarculales bacterium]|jgi:CubicO group peptidase (beta-lactamase class C family)|nr:beta-lactamase family protein [Desulfarculales bacterium]
MWHKVKELFDYGEKVAPARLVTAWKGEYHFLYAAGQARENTVFDLASLTKPLATAWLALNLPLGLNTNLDRIWPDVPNDKKLITLEQILNHSAGWPEHRPYYQQLLTHPEKERNSICRSLILTESLAFKPGKGELYSDLGYMLLGLLLEDLSAASLDKLFERSVSTLNLKSWIGFLPLNKPVKKLFDAEADIAPCGSMPELRREQIKGQVEDENAFALNGVAGHAGLFGTAGAVRDMVRQVFSTQKAKDWLSLARAVKIFNRNPELGNSTRTLLFDTPTSTSDGLSSVGSNHPPGLIGHLGFTGVSLWYQPEEDLGVIILTNRVAYGRGNMAIREFRSQAHSLIWPILDAV